MILYIILLLLAIISYAIPIIQSRTTYYKDYYHDKWMLNLLFFGCVLINVVFLFIILDNTFLPYLDNVDYNLDTSSFDIIKEYIISIGGSKKIFIVYCSCGISSLGITYLITFLGNSFQEERKMTKMGSRLWQNYP